jgi:WhiB family redox-sensing transcriptional regulator
MEQGAFAPEGGACVGKPTEWWFPLQKSGRKEEVTEIRKNTALAKTVCKECLVSRECLEYSLEWEPWGIWGGLNEEERAHLRSKKSIMLSRDGRINFAGIGLRNANGNSIKEITNDDSII